MAWEQITVDLVDVASTLNTRATGLQPGFTGSGIIEEASLRLRASARRAGEGLVPTVDMIWFFTGGSAETGWAQADVSPGGVASALTPVGNSSSVQTEPFGRLRGTRMERRFLVVWRV